MTHIYTKQEALYLVKKEGLHIFVLSTEQQNDYDIVLAAVTQTGLALRYASKELQNNKDIVLKAVSQYGEALEYASIELKINKEIVLNAVMQNGYALQHACRELKNDKEIVLAAVTNHGWSLIYASDKLKKDKELILTALFQSSNIFDLIDIKLQHDSAILFIKEHFLDIHDADWPIIKRALLENKNHFLNPETYMKTLTDEMPNPYLMLAQYALSKNALMESEPYPEIRFSL